MAKNDTGLVRLTGLWKEGTEAGDEYLVGSISPTSKLLIFVNREKAKPADPDYVAYIAAPQEREPAKQQQRTLWQDKAYG